MGKTILVVDNSPTIRKIVELTFSDTQIRVEAAGSGEEALQRISENRSDLLLIDAALPQAQGYEICRQAQQAERPIPVLMLHSSFDPFDPALARECGAHAHLAKPFETSALREEVERLLGSPTPRSTTPASETGAMEEPAAPLSPPVKPKTPAGHLAEKMAERTSAQLKGSASASGPLPLSPEQIEELADAVAARLTLRTLKEVAHDLVPELAAEIIRERLRELESEEP